MLEARSVALVGASPRPGTFGQRMTDEVTRSPASPQVYLVNPKYRRIGERPCYPSLADLPEPVDLVLLGVPDAALEQQLGLAAQRGDASAVIFGNAHEARPSQDASPDVGQDAGSDVGQDAGSAVSQDAGSAVSQDASSAVSQPGSAGRPPALGDRLAGIARSAGMALCGAGCMGFVNVSHGLRAIGYTEPDPLPAGPVALVTHSGSVFSALLRTRRAIGFSLAVSSGQELVTAAPSYLEYALSLPETRVVALVLEAMRQPDQLRRVLATAAGRGIPVVLATAGRSAAGRMMVAAHSGALAAADGGWEALSRAYGVHRVGDLAELADTLETFAIGRPVRRPAASPPGPQDGQAAGQDPALAGQDPVPGEPGPARLGIATVHDSGLERAHAADLADEIGVPFAPISEVTRDRLASILDPGLVPANPLDVWGTGADTCELFTGSLLALASDPSVALVALAIDLVHELDGDLSYPQAVLAAASQTDKPLVVLSNLGSAIDPELAALLRQAGIPVLEGMRTGLLALRHLLDHAGNRRPAGDRGGHAAARAEPGDPAAVRAAPGDHAAVQPAPGDHVAVQAAPGDHVAVRSGDAIRAARRRGAGDLLAAGAVSGVPLLALLREYGIATAGARPAASPADALAAAESVGYPVVLKTDEQEIQHKSDARGVILGIGGPAELAAAYRDLAARLGRRVLVCETVPSGTELALGIIRDADLGPLIVVGAGGVLVELLADRAVALPPVDEQLARQLLGELRISRLLAGVRGAPPADMPAVIRAITGLSALAADLGDRLEALDVNPLICGPAGAIAVDALAITRADFRSPVTRH
jgi:acyl-CoA synthetase (NDP forming)